MNKAEINKEKRPSGHTELLFKDYNLYFKRCWVDPTFVPSGGVKKREGNVFCFSTFVVLRKLSTHPKPQVSQEGRLKKYAKVGASGLPAAQVWGPSTPPQLGNLPSSSPCLWSWFFLKMNLVRFSLPFTLPRISHEDRLFGSFSLHSHHLGAIKKIQLSVVSVSLNSRLRYQLL